MKKIKLSILAATTFAASFMASAQAPSISDFVQLQAVIRFDDAPEDISFEVRNSTGKVIQSGNNYNSFFANKVLAIDIATAFGFPLTFTIFDSAGDGFSGNGGFVINTRRLQGASSRISSGNITGDRVINGRSFTSRSRVTLRSNNTISDNGFFGPLTDEDIDVVINESGDFLLTNPPPAPSNFNDVFNVSINSTTGGRIALNVSLPFDISLNEVSDALRIVIRDENGNRVSLLRRPVNLISNGRLAAFFDVPNLAPGRYFVILRSRDTSGRFRRQVLVE